MCETNGNISLIKVVCMFVFRWLEEVEGTKCNNYVDWLMMTYALSLVDLLVVSLP